MSVLSSLEPNLFGAGGMHGGIIASLLEGFRMALFSDCGIPVSI